MDRQNIIHILLYIFGFLPLALFGQRTISGCITDAADGEPIPGVTVFIANTTFATFTDEKGNYLLNIPGEGSYRLTVSHVGYQPVFKDIEPGNVSITENIAMSNHEMDEVTVSAKVKFRQKDINLFWRTILGRNPSKKTIYVLNPEDVYYYYNTETGILRVTCRVPLQIINNETGYNIQFVLEEFTHNYSTEISSWKYEYMFSELEPENDKQKTVWEENRKKIYNVSLSNFIKSLYNNTLNESGFILTYLESKEDSYPMRNSFETINTVSIDKARSASYNLNNTYESAETFLVEDAESGGKTLSIPFDLKKNLMLICCGTPITRKQISQVDKAQLGQLNWLRTGYAQNILQTPNGPVRIFPDGTCSNLLMLSPYMSSNSLLGLNLKLPLDYSPDVVSKTTPRLAEKNDVLTDEEITERFEHQLELYPQEKIHLHTDRDFYIPCEKIWLKAYVTDAAMLTTPTQSQYVYVELISPTDTLIKRVMLGLTDNMFYGCLPLTEIIPEGDYTLRAYTMYMLNQGNDYFFKKNIRIGNLNSSKISGVGFQTENEGKGINRKNEEKATSGATPAVEQKDYDVSFFPEGGNTLEGVFCKVAFKALNSNGAPADISGKVIDEKGTEVAAVETFYAGMGVFGYIPEAGKHFYLKCINENGLEKQFELPQPVSRAYTVTTQSVSDEKLLISVKKSAKAPDIPIYILAHSRGNVLYFSEWDRKQEFITMIKEALPAGVIQFMLFDSKMNPLSERLVFIKNNSAEKIEFTTDKETYSVRDKVIVSLSTLNTEVENNRILNSPQELNDNAISGLLGHFSVAITDDHDYPINESATIMSSLLLSSELKGYIENPAYYLRDNQESTMALDYLMMTHGWRRYNVADVAKAKYESPGLPFQIDRKISGQVRNMLTNRPVSEANVTLVSGGDIMISGTDKNGLFAFYELDFAENTVLLLQALSKSGSENVKLMMDNESFPILTYEHQNQLLPPAPFKNHNDTLEQVADTSASFDSFIRKAEQRIMSDIDMRDLYLPEVEVTALRIRKDEQRLRFFSNLGSSVTIRREEIEKQKFQWLADYVRANVPGVLLQSNEKGAPVLYFLRNVNSGMEELPLVYIDGFPVGGGDPNDPSNTGGFDIPPEEIESIDVFADGAGFGMRGANGVISITTRKGFAGNRLEKSNFAVYSPLGYQQPVEFYAPKYETQESKQSQTPDYRTTIYWKPDVVISDENEKATFEFYTSDFKTTYSLAIEGITTGGKIIRQVEKIIVK
ncbi:MAG: carboxypeptidase-like regulatory domain-containing protein [Tannerella sp.]|jgi:hypothetical protein|nr:carboxypeptidase-like regulatory domain-containing protein [Tannerella sp.]